MLKTLAIVVVIFLASVSATAYSQSSGWSLTVQTDKPCYYMGDVVYVNGTLTLNGWLGHTVYVTVAAIRPDNTPYPIAGSPMTDIYGNYNTSFMLAGGYAELGEYTLQVSYKTPNDGTIVNQTSFVLIDSILIDSIYIRASGQVDPPEAPISRDGNVYTLTNNIVANSTNGIIIERNDTILNGTGFTLDGKRLANSNGIYLAHVSNVTIKNISIESFQNGVNQYLCTHCHIIDTNLFSNGNGIYYQQASSSTIEGNTITKNSYAGILLDGSNDNNISGNSLSNTISSNFGAISLRGSSNDNNIVDNNFVNNKLYGVYIEASYSNKIFHNNFFNNARQGFVTFDSSGNVWDNGYVSGGNYWSDYAGVDTKSGSSQNLNGSDGIGDTPYTTYTTYGIDHYPLMHTWNPITFDETFRGNQVPIMMATNTTITNFDSTPNTLDFTASGASGTGYVLVIVPVSLNSTDIQVTKDGVPLNPPYPIITTDGTDYFIYFEFGLSSHQIQLIIAVPGLSVPAVPLGTLTAAVAMILVLACYFIISKRKGARAEMPGPESSGSNRAS